MPTFPGHVVVRRINSGGMGEVYEAVNRLGHHVALKVVRPDRCDPEFRARLRNEAAALQGLDHPHIARFFEYNDKGLPFFTMRLLTGGPLTDRLAEYQADVRRAVGLMVTLAEAVGYIHRRGLLHRDLKPSNVLFEEGQPYITDFGLVKGLASAAPTIVSGADDTAPTSAAGREEETSTLPGTSHLTGSGLAMGTVPYMAPEQLCSDKGQVGPWTDVWALGVVLFELLTGQRPFVGREDRTIQASIAKGPTPRPSDLRPGLSPALEEIVLGCLAREPQKRYASADLLAADLRRWLDGPARQRRPWRRFFLLAGLLALALGGVVAFVAWPRPAPDPDAPLRALQASLAGGNWTEWIGATGAPAHHRVVVGEGDAWVRPSWDDTFTVDTQSYALVELCPDPMRDDFRIEAEVRQNKFHLASGRVGLYVLHHRYGADQDGHCFGFWCFTEHLHEGHRLDDPPDGFSAGRAALVLQSFVWAPPGPSRPDGATTGRTHEFVTPNEGLGATWRKLVIEVGPRGASVRFDGKRVDHPRPRLDRRLRGLEGPSAAGVRISGRSGVGLCVFGSSASFRHVRIGPASP